MTASHRKTRALTPAITSTELTDRMAGIVFSRRAPLPWYLCLALALLLSLLFLYGVTGLLSTGVGIFGLNIPIAWGFPIINTIWWIGIAHAGTLISAVLLLTRQPWRTAISRAAEAMALFAIVLAGTYTLLHLGRPWFAFYLTPYPDTTELWPQWRSPLVWDFFAIATYVLYTLCFLYVSLLPDLATLRDRAQRRGRQQFYGILALGWRHSALHWYRYEQATTVLAALAAPVVVAVTGTISLDLAVSLVPGFHFTIFPPYFVAGAIYSGFATVTLIAILLRAVFGLTDFITPRHLDYLGRMMLLFVLMVDYSYIMEIFMAWYSGEPYPRAVFEARWTGTYAPAYWTMITLNVVLPQLLWWRRVRCSPAAMLVLALAADAGMWLERFIILITGPHRDYLPATWRAVSLTGWDWALYLGSIGVFFTLLLLFLRLLPPIAMHDMRPTLPPSAAGTSGTPTKEIRDTHSFPTSSGQTPK